MSPVEVPAPAVVDLPVALPAVLATYCLEVVTLVLQLVTTVPTMLVVPLAQLELMFSKANVRPVLLVSSTMESAASNVKLDALHALGLHNVQVQRLGSTSAMDKRLPAQATVPNVTVRHVRLATQVLLWSMEIVS